MLTADAVLIHQTHYHGTGLAFACVLGKGIMLPSASPSHLVQRLFCVLNLYLMAASAPAARCSIRACMSVARHAINALNRFKLFVRTTGDAGQGESDEDFDARLAKIRKNETAPGGQRKAKTPYEQLQENKKAAGQKKQQDWGAESVYFESAPHRGDLAINVLLVRPAAFASNFCHHEHQKQRQSIHAQVAVLISWRTFRRARRSCGCRSRSPRSAAAPLSSTASATSASPSSPARRGRVRLLSPCCIRPCLHLRSKCMLQPCCISLACRRGRLLPCMSAGSPGGNGRNGGPASC